MWILPQVLLEPYSRAYYFGSERVSKRYSSEPEQDTCSYKDIRALCEQSYSGYYLFYYSQTTVCSLYAVSQKTSYFFLIAPWNIGWFQ